VRLDDAPFFNPQPGSISARSTGGAINDRRCRFFTRERRASGTDTTTSAFAAHCSPRADGATSTIAAASTIASSTAGYLRSVTVVFGLSRAGEIRRIAPLTDGVVVGSALIDVYACTHGREAAERVADFFTPLIAATKSH